MENIILKSLRIYFNTFKLMASFSVFIFLSLLLLPLVSAYVSVGGGFLRFSSVLYDLTLSQVLLLVFITAISMLFIAAFICAIVSVVKLKETLDRVAFSKVICLFPKYMRGVFSLFLLLAIISLLVGVGLEAVAVPNAFIHLVLAAIWLIFIFVPYVLILEELPLNKAIRDTFTFLRRSPLALPVYLAFGLISLFLLTLFEVALGQFFVWEHYAVTLVISSVFFLPLLQILGAQLYIRRYPVTKI